MSSPRVSDCTGLQQRAVSPGNKGSAVKRVERETKMNVFRLIGDLSHLLAIILLLVKIWKSRSCAGEVAHGGCAVIEVVLTATGESRRRM